MGNNTGKTLVINLDRTCCEFSGRLVIKLNAVLQYQRYPQLPASTTSSATEFSSELLTSGGNYND